MPDIAFQTAADRVLGRSAASPASVKRYRARLGPALAAFGDVPVDRVKDDHVHQALIDARAAGLGPGSVKALLTEVRKVLQAHGNRVADGIRLRVPEPKRQALTSAQAERLRTMLTDHPADVAIGVLLATGMRIGEALGLLPEEWLADRRIVRLTETKNGRSREVDVPAWGAGLVDRLLARPMPAERTVRDRLGRLCAAAGLPSIRVHDLRHTRITNLLLGGAPPLYACSQAGHHSPGYTLAVYGHLAAATPEQRQRWAEV